MKKINLLAIAAVTAFTVFSEVQGKSTTTTTTTKTYSYTKAGDKVIYKELDRQIDACKDLDEMVSFKVEGGVVTLTGDVDNSAMRNHAGAIAKGITGVTRVDNAIDVT